MRCMGGKAETTRWLIESGAGSRDAIDRLLPRVYDELHSIAHARLRRHRPGETLNTTALVHEAYVKLVDSEQVSWESRAHFVALAARTMRSILIDYARARRTAKRGGGVRAETLDRIQVAADERAEDLLSLDDALARLLEVDERLGTLVEYRFFGGLTYEEISVVTGRSVPTVKRDWMRARAWLYDFMRS